MIAGIGVDIVDIARLEAALRRTPELAHRLFTEAELTAASDRIAGSARFAAKLAGCFAAKEALAKALGAPAGLHWTDAEVVRGPAGRPSLLVRGTVAAAAEHNGVEHWHLSLSHDAGLCVAMVVGERSDRRGGALARSLSARSQPSAQAGQAGSTARTAR